jgi:undecaprenyl-diphosphatase
MSTTEAVLLGLVQGLTEFLPISSSAHLAATRVLFGAESPGVPMAVALHFGTLLAVLIVFWRHLKKIASHAVNGARMYLAGDTVESIRERAPGLFTALAVLVGTVPVAAAGILLEQTIERVFHSLIASGAFLIVTGLALFASRLAPRPRTDRVGVGRGFLIGIAQAAALLPGISRSGATIVTGYFLGVERRASGRFSFVLAVPALAGAAIWELRRALPLLSGGPAGDTDILIEAGALAAGMLMSAFVGTVCLLLLLRGIDRGQLHWFAAYCLPVGALMAAVGCLL